MPVARAGISCKLMINTHRDMSRRQAGEKCKVCDEVLQSTSRILTYTSQFEMRMQILRTVTYQDLARHPISEAPLTGKIFRGLKPGALF